MGTDTDIEYVNHSWNPWIGCTPVSAGCDNCYARSGMKRYGKDPTIVTRTSRATWRQPLAKTRAGDYRWRPGDYVFVCSWSDFFHEDADKWRTEAWDLMRKRPDLKWVIVTKRIERAANWIPLNWEPKNRIIVVTCENQAMADERIPQLLDLHGKFDNLALVVSLEPLLEPIDLKNHFGIPDNHDDLRGLLNLAIVGCENLSGRAGRFREKIYGPTLTSKVHYRRMISLEYQARWWQAAREIKDQCQAAGVKFFMKQGPVKGRVCRDINQFPEDMRIRQFP